MKNKILITCFLILVAATLKSQNKIASVLSDISKNNKSITANEQFWEAKKLSYKTGLNPQNPKFEYEYLAGNNGDQIDYYIVQSFDFPTSYIKKRQVAKRQIEQSNFQESAFRQDILLQAKQHCLKLIYLHKKQLELSKRSENASEIYAAYQKKIAAGDATILDLNKTKIELLSIQNQVRLNQSEIDQYKQKLTELNGGQPIDFNEIHLNQINRSHFISLLYNCKIMSKPKKELKYIKGKPILGQWKWFSRCPKNIIVPHKKYKKFI